MSWKSLVCVCLGLDTSPIRSLRSALKAQIQERQCVMKEGSVCLKLRYVCPSVPEFDLSVPAAGDDLGRLVRVPERADAHLIVRFDPMIQFSRLPVPDVQLPVGITWNHVTAGRHGENELKRFTAVRTTNAETGGRAILFKLYLHINAFALKRLNKVTVFLIRTQLKSHHGLINHSEWNKTKNHNVAKLINWLLSKKKNKRNFKWSLWFPAKIMKKLIHKY